MPMTEEEIKKWKDQNKQYLISLKQYQDTCEKLENLNEKAFSIEQELMMFNGMGITERTAKIITGL